MPVICVYIYQPKIALYGIERFQWLFSWLVQSRLRRQYHHLVVKKYQSRERNITEPNRNECSNNRYFVGLGKNQQPKKPKQNQQKTDWSSIYIHVSKLRKRRQKIKTDWSRPVQCSNRDIQFCPRLYSRGLITVSHPMTRNNRPLWIKTNDVKRIVVCAIYLSNMYICRRIPRLLCAGMPIAGLKKKKNRDRTARATYQ